MKRPWGVVLLLTGCARIQACVGDDFPIVYVDLVDDASQATDAPGRIERSALEGAMREVMENWPGYSFRKAKPNETPWQVDLRVVFMSERGPSTEAKADLVHRSVGVRMRLKSLRPSEVEGEASYETEFVHRADVAPNTSWSVLAEDAVRRAGQELERTMQLSRASPEEVVRALGSEDERVRARAAMIAGTRRIHEALPGLMARVRDESEVEQVVLRSIGALVAIGDPEAAHALIDAGRRKSSAYVAQIVFALGELGGREAEAYLFTVASGHPDPALRDAARQALDNLEARDKAKTASVGAPNP